MKEPLKLMLVNIKRVRVRVVKFLNRVGKLSKCFNERGKM